MKEVAIDAVEDCRRAGTPDWMTVRAEIRSQLANFITRQTKRSPMILPILLEVEW